MDIPITLIVGAIGGDSRDLATLAEVLRPVAYRAAFSITGSQSVSEDAAQDACYVCISRLRQLRDPLAFKAWFFRIVHRSTMAEIRRTRRFYNQTEPRPRLPIILDESFMDMQAALLRLPQKLRVALVLTAVFGFSSQEAGNVLRVPAGTIRHRVFRARSILVSILNPDGDDVSYSRKASSPHHA